MHSLKRTFFITTLILCWTGTGEIGWTQDVTTDLPAKTIVDESGDSITTFFEEGPEVWTSPKGLSSSLQIMVLLTVLSLAPAVLLMTTSFVRIVVVLGLLKQALGTQQLPPSQVLTSIALFMTILIMTPAWTEVYEDAIKTCGWF